MKHMVLHIGLVISGFTIPAGIGAFLLFMGNMIVWAALSALMGSLMALVGFGMIALALVLAEKRVGRNYSDTRIRAEESAAVLS